MLVEIKSKVKFKNKVPLEIEKTVEQIKKIQENWKDVVKEDKDAFNEKIVVVTDYKIEEQEIILEVGTSFYADLMYAKNHKDLTVWVYFSGILLKTKDGFYVMTKNNKEVINLFGGMGALEDFEEEEFNPILCLERELQEELGLSLKNKGDIISFKEKYIKLAPIDLNMYPCGILYTGNLNYTKNELIAHFDGHKKDLDNEVEELLFFTKENYKNLESYSSKKPYLMELMNLVVNEE